MLPVGTAAVVAAFLHKCMIYGISMSALLLMRLWTEA